MVLHCFLLDGEWRVEIVGVDQLRVLIRAEDLVLVVVVVVVPRLGWEEERV